MSIHRFSPTIFYNTIGGHEPVLAVADGDTVITETLDAHGFDYAGKQRADKPNPMTGPFFVKGADPGDALQIHIKRITMTRPTGWTFQVLSSTVVDPAAVPRFPMREKTEWLIDIASATARLETPPAILRNFSVPVDPMIGCFGVAPGARQEISTVTSGSYGGNMDYRGFRAGVDILFPVSVPGALFFLGDVHAAQGDGEIVGTGIETASEVEFLVSVVKGSKARWPRGINDRGIFTIGNMRPLDQALQHATTEMLDWLIQDFGHDEISASHLMGQAVRYDIANVFNPAYSVVCRMGKDWVTEARSSLNR